MHAEALQRGSATSFGSSRQHNDAGVLAAWGEQDQWTNGGFRRGVDLPSNG